MFLSPSAPVDCTAAVAALVARFGDRVATGAAIRTAHGRGEGLHDVMAPAAVVFARSTADVADVVRVCRDHLLPLIPFGTGTSLEGQIQAIHGGVSLDLAGMDKVLAVNMADLDCRVEAGVTREALNALLRGDGLFFPLDPGAKASLRGMAATRASGTNAVRYGTMRDVTLGLTVVTPNRDIITTGGRARKSAAGYDLTRLYIGSEATRTELLDAEMMRACIGYSRLVGMAAMPTLFLEFHGAPAGVAEQVQQVAEIAAHHGGSDLRWAHKQEERTALWTARHNAYWAARSLKPGCEAISTDACVPISRLAEAILEAREKADAAGLMAPVVGQVGDGRRTWRSAWRHARTQTGA